MAPPSHRRQANKRVLKLVWDMMRPESLPPGWSMRFDGGDGKWWATAAAAVGRGFVARARAATCGACRSCRAQAHTSSAAAAPRHPRRWYAHAPSGALRDTHPVQDYYTGAIFMDRGGYKQLLDNMAAHPPTQDEVRCAANTAPACRCAHAHAAHARMHGVRRMHAVPLVVAAGTTP